MHLRLKTRWYSQSNTFYWKLTRTSSDIYRH